MSSGRGGRRYFDPKTRPQDLKQAFRQSEEETVNQSFEVEIAGLLSDILSAYERRDTATVNDCITKIKKALESDIEGSVDPMFGGSVRKHTAVDGISDVDSLVILKDPGLRSRSPQEVLDYFEETLRTKLHGWEIKRGQLAVTISKDGVEIQLLPAIRLESGFAIASASGDVWSKINPQAFFNQLTKVNDLVGGKVVPTIKLVKIANQTLPEPLRLTGYHIESLAVEVFKNYSGFFKFKDMLKHFFQDAPNRVLTPITDKTGQSVYVDEYLGPANSKQRLSIFYALDRIFRGIKNADANLSKDQWLRVLGEG